MDKKMLLTASLAMLGSCVGLGRFDELEGLPRPRQRDYVLSPHPLLKITPARCSTLQNEIFVNPETRYVYTLFQLPSYKGQVLCEIGVDEHLCLTFHRLTEIGRSMIKRKTSVYKFTGDAETQLYKQLAMYLYITANTGLKQRMLNFCFDVEHSPVGFAGLLNNPRTNINQTLNTLLYAVKLT